MSLILALILCITTIWFVMKFKSSKQNHELVERCPYCGSEYVEGNCLICGEPTGDTF